MSKLKLTKDDEFYIRKLLKKSISDAEHTISTWEYSGKYYHKRFVEQAKAEVIAYKALLKYFE